MRRFYIPAEQIRQAEPIITGPDAHHMRDVLRLRPGTEVTVFDGAGNDYLAHIVSTDRHQVLLAIDGPLDNICESTVHITLAQGLLKDKKMDTMVRQLTELGVTRWLPFLAARSVPALNQKRIDARYRRWQKISLEAIKQCGRNRPPSIDPLTSFADTLMQAGSHDLKLICWENFSSSVPLEQSNIAAPASVFLMIGPEGGFSKEEVFQAEEAGFQVVGMGPRILRAETAALAAVVMAQSFFGDMAENFLDNPKVVL